MLRKYKKEGILSSLLILLPILLGLLLWNRLPDSMPTHWGIDGKADNWGGKAFTVFGFPLILLAVHWLCLFITSLDPKNRNRNQKSIRLVFWIFPVISFYISAMMYSVTLGYGMNLQMAFLLVPLGLLFLIMGNFMPKFQQNYTMGIKIRWTLANEENWNQTHRFAGKCWAVGGLLLTGCIFLPGSICIAVIILTVCWMVFAPMLYSYRIYRKHLAQGIEYPKVAYLGSKKAAVALTVFLVILFIFLAALMFTGTVEVTCGDAAFTVEASFCPDLTVDYTAVEDIAYREDWVFGSRASGFYSSRLSLGIWNNETAGSYSLYACNSCSDCVVLTVNGNTLAINAPTVQQTQQLYQELLAHIPV